MTPEELNAAFDRLCETPLDQTIFKTKYSQRAIARHFFDSGYKLAMERVCECRWKEGVSHCQHCGGNLVVKPKTEEKI